MSDEPIPSPADTSATPEAPEESPDRRRGVVEALLFATDSPLSPAKLSAAAEMTSGQVKTAIDELNARYEQMGASFRIEAIAGGYQMLTLPEYHDALTRLLSTKKDTRLSNAAMETLAIIAYRQPILRADIEAIRGVACGEVIRTLLEKQLAKIVGRAEVIGRPMLYGTTKHFLEVFGLADLDDLPRVEELRSGAEAERPGRESESPSACENPEDESAEEDDDDGDQNLEDEDEFEDDDEFDEEDDRERN